GGSPCVPFPRHVPVQGTRTAATLEVAVAAAFQAGGVDRADRPRQPPRGRACGPGRARARGVRPATRARPAPGAGAGTALGAAGRGGRRAGAAGGRARPAAFPPVGAWPLAPLGPALLVLALQGRRLRSSLLAGLLFGLALFVPLLSWLINVAWYAWAALAIAEAVIFA